MAGCTDSSKINKTAFFRMLALEDVDGIIVDADFPADYEEYMRLKEIAVI